jgi:hypothetical protein
MEPEVQALIDKIAARYPSPDTALNKCSIACGLLNDDLAAIGVHDVQQIEVSEPRESTRPHPDLPQAHQVLRIGTEFADVTWMQIDIHAEHPHKLYSSIGELRADWAVVRDWNDRREL